MSVDRPASPPPDKAPEAGSEAGSAPGAIWRRVRRNSAIIVGERVIFGFLNLAAAALAVRAVGAEAFGVVILLQAYVRLISGLLKFQSWAAVTKFGAEAMADGDEPRFRRLIGFTLRLDILGSAATILLGMLALPYAAALLDWPEEAQALAPWFMLTAPFITHGTPTGVLRLLDRFIVLARQHALNAVLRFIGSLAIFLAPMFGDFGDGGLGAGALIVVWGAASFISGGYMIGSAVRAMRARGLTPRLGGSWRFLTRSFPQIWRFVIVMNANSFLATVTTHGTVLVVGAMLGPVAAGLFGLVRQFTDPLNRLSSLIGPVLFPEFAWLETRRDRRGIAALLWRTLLVSGAALALVCLALAGVGEQLLSLLFGDQAGPAYPLLIAAGAAAGFNAIGFAMAPVMLTIRKEKALLTTALLWTAVFGAALYGFILGFGLLGAGLAMLLRQSMLFLHRLAILYRTLVIRERAR